MRRTTSDFSYYNRQLAGDRLLRVGDAAGFMDPIFSAGVFLAMWSGKIAAEVVEKSLAQGRPNRRLFASYEKRVRKGLMFYWHVVENYYTTPFMELFLQPRDHHDLPSAVNAVLAGELEGGWSVRWRLKYFFLLVKLQKRWPLVPRISFRPGRVNVSKILRMCRENLKPPMAVGAIRSGRFIFKVAALLLLLCAGCATPPLPPADFSAPGWRVQQGQAVWKPSSSRPELAGDLLLATNVNGNFFVQFSKMPFPLATAQVSGD